MTTDKERAVAYRQIADLYESIGKDAQARVNRNCADELDPPKHEYPDGTIAWVDYGDYDFRQLCVRVGDEWLVGNDQPLIPDGVTKVEPLRVLADDEIAVPVVTKAVGALRDYADHLCREYFYANCGSAVISAYIEAVEDAEAGEAK